METWHATAKTLPHAHSSIWRLQGLGVGFRGGASGWGDVQNKPGSPWRKLIAIHNFVASAFLHYKICTQNLYASNKSLSRREFKHKAFLHAIVRTPGLILCAAKLICLLILFLKQTPLIDTGKPLTRLMTNDHEQTCNWPLWCNCPS